MKTIPLYRINYLNDGDIIFETVITPSNELDIIKQRISNELEELSELEQENLKTIETLNKEIDKLTNHADSTDNIVAACSGILCGLIDSIFVGEFSIDNATSWGKDKVDSFVKKIAKSQGCNSDDLTQCVRHLEKKFPIPADNATSLFGGGLQHHIRDFSHHPNILGLTFSMLTQYTGRVYGTNVYGAFCSYEVEDKSLIGKGHAEKISIGCVSWFFHMASDMAGSSGSICNGKYGTGLPGPLVSFLKVLSSLPIFQSKDSTNKFSKFVSRLFNGTLLSKRDEEGKIIPDTVVRFDLRTEIGAVKELGKQAIPVIINECIVRGFYFIRRICSEYKRIHVDSISEFIKNIDWDKCLPYKNRTVTRMLTIAHGSFVAFDLIDAAVRTAASGQFTDPLTFLARMGLRVNIVGVGRFVIALGTDINMGIEKKKKENQRLYEVSKNLFIKDAKVQLYKANLWIEVKEFQQSKLLLEQEAEISSFVMKNSIVETGRVATAILTYRNGIDKNNPGLLDDISKILF
ncbi:MAG: hypothetical protein K2K94_03340 [Muribaculaceae bacterium]|nr:hypothetical protein [Muribaculaceae bacterium]